MMWENVAKVAALCLASLVALFLLTKLMGNRQMSQLTMFDYIIGISFGSLAAEMAAHPDPESWLILESMVIYALAAVGINILNTHSLKARKLFLGAPLVLYDQGKLYLTSLRKAKVDLNELLAECRAAGYFDLSQLEMIILEVNGKLSFLPVSAYRPVEPADLQLQPRQERPQVAVIMDGVVFPKRLAAIGFDQNWLDKQLKAQGYDGHKDVLLACVADGQLTVYGRHDQQQPKKHYA